MLWLRIWRAKSPSSEILDGDAFVADGRDQIIAKERDRGDLGDLLEQSSHSCPPGVPGGYFLCISLE